MHRISDSLEAWDYLSWVNVRALEENSARPCMVTEAP